MLVFNSTVKSTLFFNYHQHLNYFYPFFFWRLVPILLRRFAFFNILIRTLHGHMVCTILNLRCVCKTLDRSSYALRYSRMCVCIAGPSMDESCCEINRKLSHYRLYRKKRKKDVRTLNYFYPFFCMFGPQFYFEGLLFSTSSRERFTAIWCALYWICVAFVRP